MPAYQFELNAYQDSYRQQLLSVWEQSVLATHRFLSKTDFNEIKAMLQSFNFYQLQVYCLIREDRVIGFIGVAYHKIEMLFLQPDYRGRGLGKKLLNFAINELAANKLDVNEQNEQAVKFYQKAGFETYEKTERDDQGRNYPLLRMHRSTVVNDIPIV